MEIIVILVWLLTFLISIIIEILSWPIEALVWLVNFLVDIILKIF